MQEETNSRDDFYNYYGYLESDPLKEEIIKCHKDLAKNLEPSKDKLEESIKQLKKEEEDRLERLRACTMIRKILSMGVDPKVIEAVIDLGGVEKLVDIVKTSKEQLLRCEASWCLVNLLVGEEKHVNALSKKGVGQVLNDCLLDDYLAVVEQSVWGVGNYACSGIYYRDQLLDLGALESLVKIYEKYKFLAKAKQFNKQLIWAASNLLRLKPAPEQTNMACAVPMFCQVFKIEMKRYCETSRGRMDVPCNLIDSNFSLSKIKEKSLTFQMVSLGVVKLIVDMFVAKPYKESPIVVTYPCAKILENIMDKRKSICDKVVKSGLLAKILPLLDSQDRRVKLKVCKVLSSFTLGSKYNLSEIFVKKPQILEKVMILCTDENPEVRMEAVSLIFNMTDRIKRNELGYLLRENVIGLLRNILDSDQEAFVEILALKSLLNLLEGTVTWFGASNDTQNPLSEKLERIGLAKLIRQSLARLKESGRGLNLQDRFKQYLEED